MDTNIPILARKYAQAFLNIFQEQLSIEDIKSIKLFRNYFKEYPNALFYLQLNSIADEVKMEALSTIRSSYSLHEGFDNLSRLLIKDKRISLLPVVLEVVEELYKEKHNIIDFVFSYASEISKEQVEALKKFLERKTNKVVKYSLKKDPSLIAGVKLFSKDLLWEYSVKHQIESLNGFK